jgi:glycosyltransferase involved in cell wall biosynthesis
MPDKRKNLLFLTDGSPDPNLASRRLRVYELIPFIKDTFNSVCESAPRTIIETIKLRKKINATDIIIIQKELLPWILILALRVFRKPIVYDFDDAVYIRHRPITMSYVKSYKLLGRFKNICKHASLIIAGNRILEQSAKNAGAKKTAVIPTSVLAQKNSTLPGKNKKIILGWIGHSINMPYLEALENVFIELESENFLFELHVMCNKPPQFVSYSSYEFFKWSEKSEKNFLSNIDIGLMPLPDNLYTQGKCAYKALQYMAYSKPVVVSDVGINAEWTKNAGYATKNNEGTITALKKLINSKSMRLKFGKSGQIIIKNKFERKKIANEFKNTILGIIR